jgi:hypothetical protein
MKVKQWENSVANRAALMFQKIMWNNS